MKLDLEAAELTKKLQDCKIAEEESRPNDSIAAYEYIITYKFKNEDAVQYSHSVSMLLTLKTWEKLQKG
jgi:hypothetical protein